MAAIFLAAHSSPATLASWGSDALTTIRRDYYLPDQGLYADKYEIGKKPTQVAYTWGVGVMLSALNAAAAYDPKYKPWLKEYADKSHVYWNPTGPVAGYDVLPTPKPVDRYYDDNAWMVMALVDASKVLNDRKYLQWAEETLKYVLSGEDDKLGGGIYWKETAKTSKNTCSNGPSAAACLSVFDITKDPKLIAKAKQLYSWTKENLQDPADSLYWDSIGLDKRIAKDKWSYNTALMLRTASELYRITNESQYEHDATELYVASTEHWLTSSNDSMSDEGKFAHLLFEAWLIYARDTAAGAPIGFDPDKSLASIHDLVRTSLGLYGSRWDRSPSANQKGFELIDQASAARAYFEAANFERSLDKAKW